MNKADKVFVTKPSLPPLSEFIPYLKSIWTSKELTNCAKFHQEFEEAICDYLGVKYCSLFCNGTIALLVGLQALEITGEVITTPFTFVATAHSIYWNKCTPVFCDIEEEYFTISPESVERKITSKTSAILPVHVYGNPCKLEALKNIAEKYNLKLFYDAAHAFGVKVDGQSILNFGDLSMLSFHGTKIFNTFEGGALITNDPELKKRIDFLKNFGFANETSVIGLGINGKMNEFQAALGVLQLKYIDDEIKKCQRIAFSYRESLKDIAGITFLDDIDGVQHNYSYFPIIVEQGKYGKSRDFLYENFKKHNIYTRRYFYPLVSEFPPYNINSNIFPVANRISNQIICLPIYPDLPTGQLNRIIEIVKG
jgi:dTDP-4-amino-4,6-dideoxygalactose transaminase